MGKGKDGEQGSGRLGRQAFWRVPLRAHSHTRRLLRVTCRMEKARRHALRQLEQPEEEGASGLELEPKQEMW